MKNKNQMSKSMHENENIPILVTGMSRSGTTWTGKILAQPINVSYIYEPFNPDVKNVFLGCFLRQPLGLKKKFIYPSSRHASALQQRVAKLLCRAQQGGQRPLIKDPIAALATGWLADEFDLQVVVTLRHPASVAASRLKLGWTFDFADIISQTNLMNGPLSEFADDLLKYVHNNREIDIVSDSAWLWRIVYTYLLDKNAHRKNWIIVRHEELCRNPINIFKDLYKKLGLDFSLSVREMILNQTQAKESENSKQPTQHSHERNSMEIPNAWRTSLSSEQIQKVRCIVDKLGQHLYPEETW